MFQSWRAKSKPKTKHGFNELRELNLEETTKKSHSACQVYYPGGGIGLGQYEEKVSDRQLHSAKGGIRRRGKIVP